MPADDILGILGTTQAGEFRVESAVAEGGFSVVYRAQHAGFRAPVALKCLKLPPKLTSEQREIYVEKFREEAELLFHLSAVIPEIVRPLQVGSLTLEGDRLVPFLALEWLDGEALDEMIDARAAAGKPPMNAHKAVRLLGPVARALHRAHNFSGRSGVTSVIHRDIKPENIFIAKLGGETVVKVLDFGIATAMRAAEERARGPLAKEKPSQNWFTPRYGAPEQWSPERYGEVGPWTDVWALALTLTATLSGDSPIPEDLGEMPKVIFDARRRPTPRVLGVEVSGAVEATLARALAIDPSKRHPSIEAFWRELESELRLVSAFQRDERVSPSTVPPPDVGGAAPPRPVDLGELDDVGSSAGHGRAVPFADQQVGLEELLLDLEPDPPVCARPPSLVVPVKVKPVKPAKPPRPPPRQADDSESAGASPFDSGLDPVDPLELKLASVAPRGSLGSIDISGPPSARLGGPRADNHPVPGGPRARGTRPARRGARLRRERATRGGRSR